MVVRLQQTPDWKLTSGTDIDGVMNLSDCYIRHSNQSCSVASSMLTSWKTGIQTGEQCFSLEHYVEKKYENYS